MRNIFALTKREQRIIIAIVVLLVAASLAKHYLEIRPELRPTKSTSTLSPTVTPPARAEELSEDNEAPQEDR